MDRRASIRLGMLLAEALSTWAAPLTARAQSLSCADCSTSPPEPTSVLYRLSETSAFLYGCYPPCLCPVLYREEMEGTFVLTPTTFDGLYQHYSLCEIEWTVSSASGPPRVFRGNGAYRVGGEVAVQHELDLCVSMNGGVPQRYRSGLVSGGGSFPRIDIESALHGFFCWDSVLAVHATPATANVSGSSGGILSLQATPNPTRGSVDLSFALGRAGLASLTLVDAQGREVRAMDRGTWRTPGDHRLRWDGLREDGSHAPAGVYFVRLRMQGREATRSFVKL